MDNRNPFKILQVDPDADQFVIDAAYKSLARRYHPDAGHADDELMKEINWAYDELSDPMKRAGYKDYFYQPKQQSAPPPPHQPADETKKKSFFQHITHEYIMPALFISFALCVPAIVGWSEEKLATLFSKPTPTEIQRWKPATPTPQKIKQNSYEPTQSLAEVFDGKVDCINAAATGDSLDGLSCVYGKVSEYSGDYEYFSITIDDYVYARLDNPDNIDIIRDENIDKTNICVEIVGDARKNAFLAIYSESLFDCRATPPKPFTTAEPSTISLLVSGPKSSNGFIDKGCYSWNTITKAQDGKELCVCGTVRSTSSDDNNFYIALKDQPGTYQFISVGYWYFAVNNGDNLCGVGTVRNVNGNLLLYIDELWE